MIRQKLKELTIINEKIQELLEVDRCFTQHFTAFYHIMDVNNSDFVALDKERLKISYKNETGLILIIVELLKQYIEVKKVSFEIEKTLSSFDKEGLFTWYSLPEEIKQELRALKCEFECFAEIIDLFSMLQYRNDKKLFGQYYTPDYLVEKVIKTSGIGFHDLETSKIADPACGSGAFLRGMLLKLFKRNISVEKICEIVNSNFFGYDINPFAVFLCKMTLLLTIIDQCKTSDEIIAVSEIINLHNIKNVNTITTIIEEKFDFIVGNPPYFKLKNSLVKIDHCYKEILNGQGNIYVLFIYWSLLHIREKGHINLIIPQSIRSGNYFDNIRTELSKLSIKEIIAIDSRNRNQVFNDAEQAVLVIHIKNELAKKGSKTRVLISSDGRTTNIAGVFKQNEIISQESITLPIDEFSNNVVQKIKNKFKKFSEVESELIFGNGLFVWNQNKQSLSNCADGKYPIIYANYITRRNFVFQPDKNNQSVIRGRKPYCQPNEKLQNFIYSGERLVIKRTSGIENFHRINSCIISKEFLAIHNQYFIENHVNMLYNKKDKNLLIEYDKMLYIQAFLSSSIINFIFKLSNGNTQVSASELNSLPYSKDRQDEVIELIKQKADNEIIDRLFYEIFGLTIKEIEMVEKYKRGFSR